MNALTISYRFSTTELCTLLEATRIGPLPGAPLQPVDAATARETLDRLSGEGMLMVAGETLYIDKRINFLLRAAAGSGAAAAVTDDTRTLVLWRAERLFILGAFSGKDGCALTPLQDAAEAQTALADALHRTLRPLRAANVFNPERRIDIPADSRATEQEIAHCVMELL